MGVPRGSAASGPAGPTAASASVADAVAAAAAVVGEEEAREIVAAIMERPRFWPALHSDDEITAVQLRRVRDAAARRAAGAPIQYAVGRAAFRSITVAVDERVLIPRPETEQLVDLVLERVATRPGGIAVDVGTGSGVIAISLAREGRFDRVIGTDVSLDALEVAAANARSIDDLPPGKVEFRAGSLLAPVDGMRPRAVVANLPYIALDEAPLLPALVRDWEPPVALFGGSDGMDVIRRLVPAAGKLLEGDGLLALEVDAGRAPQTHALIISSGFFDDVQLVRDLAGRQRFVLARRRAEEGD